MCSISQAEDLGFFNLGFAGLNKKPPDMGAIFAVLLSLHHNESLIFYFIFSFLCVSADHFPDAGKLTCFGFKSCINGHPVNVATFFAIFRLTGDFPSFRRVGWLIPALAAKSFAVILFLYKYLSSLNIHHPFLIFHDNSIPYPLRQHIISPVEYIFALC